LKFECKQSGLSATAMIGGMFKYVKIHSIVGPSFCYGNRVEM